MGTAEGGQRPRNGGDTCGNGRGRHWHRLWGVARRIDEHELWLIWLGWFGICFLRLWCVADDFVPFLASSHLEISNTKI